MPCLGNCLGSSTTGSVDLRKQARHQLTSELNENDQPKGESYKKLRNSFLGEPNTTLNLPQPPTTGPPKPPPMPPVGQPRTTVQLPTVKKSSKNEMLKAKKLAKATLKDHSNLETHPKMIYLSQDADEPTGETIDMEILEPLVPRVNSPSTSFPMIMANVGPPSMDFNLYAAKKNISQGLIDIALLTANFSQLKFILSKGTKWPSQVDFTSWNETFKFINLTLILTSIGLQILVGIALLLSARLNLNDDGRTRRAETCNTLIIVCVFIITIINIFIVVFLDGYEEFELV